MHTNSKRWRSVIALYLDIVIENRQLYTQRNLFLSINPNINEIVRDTYKMLALNSKL